MDLIQKRLRFGRLRKDAKHILQLAKGIAEQVRIDIRLDGLQPCGQILAPCAPGKPRLRPDFVMASENGARGEAVQPGERLVQPSLDALGQARRLRNVFLRFIEAAELLIGSSAQEQGLAVAASKLQRSR